MLMAVKFGNRFGPALAAILGAHHRPATFPGPPVVFYASSAGSGSGRLAAHWERKMANEIGRRERAMAKGLLNGCKFLALTLTRRASPSTVRTLFKGRLADSQGTIQTDAGLLHHEIAHEINVRRLCSGGIGGCQQRMLRLQPRLRHDLRRACLPGAGLCHDSAGGLPATGRFNAADHRANARVLAMRSGMHLPVAPFPANCIAGLLRRDPIHCGSKRNGTTIRAASAAESSAAESSAAEPSSAESSAAEA